MPRALPPLADAFDRQIRLSGELIGSLEAAQIVLRGRGAAQGEISLTSLELGYELAFLRTFLAWEVFLEGVFYRLLCGYSRSGMLEPLKAGRTYFHKIADAESAVLSGRQYKLWHSSSQVITRSQGFFHNGNFELVLSSAQTRLDSFAAVRHRIAHSQDHATQEFNRATQRLAGRRYRGSRPGRFLRDRVIGTSPPVRWIDGISQELSGLAHQICP